MQYKVPQNVDIEDKVIGPLTIRQFLIILIAAGIIIFLNFTFIGPLRLLFWFSAMLVAGGAGAIAFARYGDQNSESFLFGAIKTLTTPRKRVWKKPEPELSAHEPIVPQKAEEKIVIKKSLEEVKDDLNKLAEYVDTGGAIGISQKDRGLIIANIKGEEPASDILTNAEKPNQIIDGFIEKVQKIIPKREPLISEVASVSPAKEFEYDKIVTK